MSAVCRLLIFFNAAWLYLCCFGVNIIHFTSSAVVSQVKIGIDIQIIKKNNTSSSCKSYRPYLHTSTNLVLISISYKPIIKISWKRLLSVLWYFLILFILLIYKNFTRKIQTPKKTDDLSHCMLRTSSKWLFLLQLK